MNEFKDWINFAALKPFAWLFCGGYFFGLRLNHVSFFSKLKEIFVNLKDLFSNLQELFTIIRDWIVSETDQPIEDNAGSIEQSSEDKKEDKVSKDPTPEKPEAPLDPKPIQTDNQDPFQVEVIAEDTSSSNENNTSNLEVNNDENIVTQKNDSL